MALDGTGMIMRNLITLIGEKRIADVFATFDTIKAGVLQVMGALNAIGQEQQAARDLAAQRHSEIMAAIAALDQGSARTLPLKNGHDTEGRTDHAKL